MKLKVLNDKYKKARGGYSRLLDITCSKCDNHICLYQKDGSGMLKRMYLDRMIDIKQKLSKSLVCSKCKEVLGVLIIYKKENRNAYRLFAGSVSKKITKF